MCLTTNESHCFEEEGAITMNRTRKKNNNTKMKENTGKEFYFYLMLNVRRRKK